VRRIADHAVARGKRRIGFVLGAVALDVSEGKTRDRRLTAEKVGQVLPAVGGKDDPTRSLFSMEAKSNPAFAPLKKTTVTMVKGQYKMIYYTGLESNDSFELYDLQNDSEELHDIYPELPVSAEPLKEELLEELAKVNSNYQKD